MSLFRGEGAIMPEDYLRCVRTPGSKKFTKSLPGGHYVRGCKLPGSDTAVWGERKKAKGGSTIIKPKD